MPWKFRTRHRCKRFLYRSDIILNVSSTVPPSDGKYDPGVDGNLAGDPLDWSWPVPRHCRPSPLPSQGQQVQRERIIKDCVWNSTNITSILYKSNHALHQVPNKQKKLFLGDLSQICLPTPGFLWFSGWFGWVLRGLDLVWESATPPTHIWERYPKKTVFFYTFPNWEI